MNHQINRLIHFGLQHHLISEDDEIYAVNLLLDLFHLDSFIKEEINEELSVATDILEEMLDYATQEGLIENNITERDLFDTRIMNCLMPRPSEVIQTFKKYYKRYSYKKKELFSCLLFLLLETGGTKDCIKTEGNAQKRKERSFPFYRKSENFHVFTPDLRFFFEKIHKICYNDFDIHKSRKGESCNGKENTNHP